MSEEEMKNVSEEVTQEEEATAPAACEAAAEEKAPKGKVDKFFEITKRGSNVRTEIIAGIVTFLAMAYILTLNPIIIVGPTSPLWSSVFIATAFGAVIGTVLMALLAKLPLAQAPGLGLNAMVGGILGGSLGFACSFGNAMLLVLISGVIFLLLSVIKIKGVAIREMIFHGIPKSVRQAISIGIGLFIAFIGLQNSGIITDAGTLVTLVDFKSWTLATVGAPLVCLFAFLVIAVLSHFKVKGAVIIGIAAGAILGIPLGVTEWSGMTWKFWEYFEDFFSFKSAEGGTFLVAFTEGFSWAEGASVIACIMTVIAFCMIDMFDTMGTCVGCCQAAGLMDENGTPRNYNQIMVADSVATCAGALLGTSTVTTFVESGAGVAEGGKTGLTALTTAILFALSIFLLPVFASIPGAAASAALLYVGCLMLKGVTKLELDSIKNTVPAFLTIAMMPLAYSITTGIGFGLLSYVIIDVVCYLVDLVKYACAKNKETAVKPAWDLHVITIIIAVLFLVYFFVPTTF